MSSPPHPKQGILFRKGEAVYTSDLNIDEHLI